MVDTNIVFSVLLGGGDRLVAAFFYSDVSLHYCETLLIELFRHKEKLVRLHPSRSGERLERMLQSVLRRMELVREDRIDRRHWDEATRLCGDVDPDDIPHVALTLSLGGRLWTGDQKLKRGLRAKGFDRFFEISG